MHGKQNSPLLPPQAREQPRQYQKPEKKPPLRVMNKYLFAAGGAAKVQNCCIKLLSDHKGREKTDGRISQEQHTWEAEDDGTCKQSFLWKGIGTHTSKTSSALHIHRHACSRGDSLSS